MSGRLAATPFTAVTAGLAPPVIVFCKSHSGSRLLTAALQRLGVFMGSVLNESLDSLPMLPLVEHTVLRHHPGFADWRTHGDEAAAALLARGLDQHFNGQPRATPRWGWKLCETVYAVPILEQAFPEARYIHLVRDGRDVAFCDHAVPDTPLWKKVSFGTDRVMTWRGRRLSHKDYRRGSHVFNAAHWLASVSLGRSYGAMLGPRYLEIRYEDLCRDFLGQMTVVADFLGIEGRGGPLAELSSRVSTASIGKHRLRPAAAVREVLEIETPLLLSLGYFDADPLAKPSQSLRRRLSAWMARTPDRDAA